jgi:WD40 repeat protein/serine/threonine protein kinase
VAEHPEHADELRKVWPSLAILADLRNVEGRSSLSFPPGADPAALTGDLGDFRILREIGRGGMGVVYEAEQISLARRVALKVLPFAGVLDERQLQRFRNEARAAAGLHHPHIVPVYAVGCERGVHYYAMQFIEGRNLAGVLAELRGQPRRPAGNAGESTHTDRDQRPAHVRTESAETQVRPAATTIGGRPGEITIHDIVEWTIQAADALDYAHSVGIVHRDVKPSNLLIDTCGRIWVTDFGLAQFEADPGLTLTGDVLGTLRYMCPEQALGQRGVVDQRADVYSLGATLYELLTLVPVCASTNRAELLRWIEQEDPPPPRRRNRAIPPELETIVLKAIAKDPAARYATARDFADDLRRFREDRPIAARRPGWREQSRKWSRRHRALTRSLAAASVFSCLSLLIASLLVIREHAETVRQRNHARQMAAEATAGVQQVRERESVIRRYLYAADIQLAAQAYHRAQIPLVRELLERHSPAADSSDERGFEWYLLRGLCHDEPRVCRGHARDVFRVAYSADGSLLASSSRDRSVIVWDAAAGTPAVKLDDFRDDVNAVAFSSDATLLATAEENRQARVWDWRSGREVARFAEFEHPVADVYFTADQRFLVTTEVDWSYVNPQAFRSSVWDLATHRLFAAVNGYRALAVDSQACLVAACDAAGHLGLWSLPDLKPLANWSGVPGRTLCATFSGDGRYLLTGHSSDHKIHLWRTGDCSEIPFSSDRVRPVRGLAVTSDFSELVSVHDDGTCRIWDVTSRTTQKVLPSDDERLWSVAIAPANDKLAIGGEHGSIVLRHLNGIARERRRIVDDSDGQSLRAVALDTAGRRLAIARGSSISILDAESARQLSTMAHPGGHRVLGLCFAPDDRSLWIGDTNGEIRRIDLVTSQFSDAQALYDAPVQHLNICVSRSGLVATSGHQNGWSIRLWNPESSGRLLAIDPREHALVSFLDDGALLTSHDDAHGGAVDVSDVASGRIIRQFSGAADAVAVDTRGEILATAAGDGSIRLFRTASGRERATLPGHRDPAVRLAFSPDGRTLASVTTSGEVKLWHVPTAQFLCDLTGAWSGGVQLLAFSPDGRRLYCAADGHAVFVWDARPAD